MNSFVNFLFLKAIRLLFVTLLIKLFVTLS